MSFVLISLFACGTTDTTDTSGGGGDTGPGEADEIPWTGDCPAASGVIDGAHLEYVYTATWEEHNDRSGGWTYDVSANGDGTYTGVMTIEVAGVNNTMEEVDTLGYGCDADGLWLVSKRVDSTVTVYEPYEGFLEYTLDAPVLLMPVDMETGTKWKTEYAGSTMNELDQKRAINESYVTEVMGNEAVDVPAGSWTAMRWTRTSSLGTETNSWVVSGLGLVKDDDSDLTVAPK